MVEFFLGVIFPLCNSSTHLATCLLDCLDDGRSPWFLLLCAVCLVTATIAMSETVRTRERLIASQRELTPSPCLLPPRRKLREWPYTLFAQCARSGEAARHQICNSACANLIPVPGLIYKRRNTQLSIWRLSLAARRRSPIRIPSPQMDLNRGRE